MKGKLKKRCYLVKCYAFIYGIRLCVIEIEISDKSKPEQKKSSFALTFYCKYGNKTL